VERYSLHMHLSEDTLAVGAVEVEGLATLRAQEGLSQAGFT
jgi:hypothetical protein